MQWRLFCKTLVSLFWYHLKLLNSWEYFNLIFQLSHYKMSILCCFGRSGTKTHKTTGDEHFINSKARYSISCCTDKVLDLVPNQRKVESSIILSSARSAPGSRLRSNSWSKIHYLNRNWRSWRCLCWSLTLKQLHLVMVKINYLLPG